MTHRLDVARGHDIVERWCALAEQRLEHLTELFETGRWRRYHSELAFLENIKEAKAAVELWRDLLTREASRDSSAVDRAWLGQAGSALPSSDSARDRAYRFVPPSAGIPVPPPLDVSIRLKGIHASSNEQVLPATELRPAVLAITPELAPALPLDATVIHERYPLLRNAL